MGRELVQVGRAPLAPAKAGGSQGRLFDRRLLVSVARTADQTGASPATAARLSRPFKQSVGRVRCCCRCCCLLKLLLLGAGFAFVQCKRVFALSDAGALFCKLAESPWRSACVGAVCATISRKSCLLNMLACGQQTSSTDLGGGKA